MKIKVLIFILLLLGCTNSYAISVSTSISPNRFLDQGETENYSFDLGNYFSRWKDFDFRPYVLTGGAATFRFYDDQSDPSVTTVGSSQGFKFYGQSTSDIKFSTDGLYYYRNIVNWLELKKTSTSTFESETTEVTLGNVTDTGSSFITEYSGADPDAPTTNPYSDWAYERVHPYRSSFVSDDESYCMLYAQPIPGSSFSTQCEKYYTIYDFYWGATRDHYVDSIVYDPSGYWNISIPMTDSMFSSIANNHALPFSVSSIIGDSVFYGASLNFSASSRVSLGLTGDDVPDLSFPINGDDLNDDIPSVPEPATLALFGIGLAGLGFARKKKKSA